jgi:hypothetical protein
MSNILDYVRPADQRTYAKAKDFLLSTNRAPLRNSITGKIEAWLHINEDGELVRSVRKYLLPKVDETWDTYVVTSQTTYTKNGGAPVTFTGEITLEVGKDSVIDLGTWGSFTRVGGLTIRYGRKRIVKRGEIDQTDIVVGDGSQTERKGLQMVSGTGDVFLEGTLINGNQLGDALWINDVDSSPKKYVMQFCKCVGISATDEADVTAGDHPDWIQFQQNNGDYQQAELHVYETYVDSSYQGITTNDGFKRLELEHVFYDGQPGNWDDSLTPGYFLGIFTGTGDAVREIVFGEDVEVRRTLDAGSTIGPVFPETIPETGYGIVFDPTLPDPDWLRVDYGTTFVAPDDIVIGTVDDIEAALEAHRIDTTNVHNIANTEIVVLGINHGATAGTTRPLAANGSPWPGQVIWTGTVTPSNAIAGDIIVLS